MVLPEHERCGTPRLAGGAPTHDRNDLSRPKETQYLPACVTICRTAGAFTFRVMACCYYRTIDDAYRRARLVLCPLFVPPYLRCPDNSDAPQSRFLIYGLGKASSRPSRPEVLSRDMHRPLCRNSRRYACQAKFRHGKSRLAAGSQRSRGSGSPMGGSACPGPERQRGLCRDHGTTPSGVQGLGTPSLP